MKKTVLTCAAVLFLSSTAMAQNSASGSSKNTAAPHASAKAVIMSGVVSDDAKNFVSDDNTIWTVSNPAVLMGHEGQEVSVKCQLAEKNTIRVFSVKLGVREVHYAANKGDSAFRR